MSTNITPVDGDSKQTENNSMDIDNPQDIKTKELSQSEEAIISNEVIHLEIEKIDPDDDMDASTSITNDTSENVDLSCPNIEPAVKEAAKYDPIPGCSTMLNDHIQPCQKGGMNVQLFMKDSDPQMYDVKGPLVTAPIVTKNLPKVFEFLPIHGKPQENQSLKDFYANKIREFVGCGLSDYEFSQLQEYCSPELLKTGRETVMGTSVPVMGVVTGNIVRNLNDPPMTENIPDLCILKKHKLRNEKDTKGLFPKKLKYRGVRILPFTQEVYNEAPTKPSADVPDVDLEPGRDILYRVRVYRPYTYTLAKDRFTRTRHSVFCCDIILSGRHKLSELRDRFVCHNDFDMRVDVSNHPDMLPNTKAKEVFPSGFLFINNVFYVDTREGCIDYSEPIRAWAVKRNIGVFPKKDMCAVKLEDLVLKLGYPEVYVHQGNCEHVFLFSEVRLLNPSDPLRLHNYPCSTAIAQNQTVYCTTCAEFSAKWIVVGCSRVPFDPAFFCETCFRQYLYKDGQKIGEFKAYSYRGNALNVLKPQ